MATKNAIVVTPKKKSPWTNILTMLHRMKMRVQYGVRKRVGVTKQKKRDDTLGGEMIGLQTS